MNLRDAVDVLKSKNIEVALDIGEHWYCQLDSNCPIAIKLHKIIKEAGLNFLDMLEGHEELTAPVPQGTNIDDLEDIDCKATISVAGKTVEIDLRETVSGQVMNSIERKLAQLDGEKQKLKSLGEGLYRTYLHEIQRLRDNHVLAQFSSPIDELLKYQVLSSSEGDNYLFFFKTVYEPGYLVDNGIRYEIRKTDRDSIRRNAFLQIKVTSTGKVSQVILLDTRGGKLRHYHGTGWDCWGNVNLRLDSFTLRSLYKLSVIIMRSVNTINMNSLMNREPDGMPQVADLKRRAKKLGREGELGSSESTPTGGWGRPANTRRTRTTPTIDEGIEMPEVEIFNDENVQPEDAGGTPRVTPNNTDRRRWGRRTNGG